MLYSDFCGFNLNLVKSGIVIGCIDLVSILYDAFVNYDAFEGCEKFARYFWSFS